MLFCNILWVVFFVWYHVLNTALFDIERVNERNSNMEVKADLGRGFYIDSKAK